MIRFSAIIVLASMLIPLNSLRCKGSFAIKKPDRGYNFPLSEDCPASANFCVVGNGTITYPNNTVLNTETYPVIFQCCDAFLSNISDTYLDKLAGLDCDGGDGPHSLKTSHYDSSMKENYLFDGKWTCSAQSNVHDDAARLYASSLSLLAMIICTCTYVLQ
ncbi:hypothetical protein AAVH_13248 [Aphelenchoides avenae]|nr:hypothetical protein AAVH_13248 [Aphelenchus avenae]